MRGEPQHFTFSKVMCWVAADRGARLAALRGEKARADAWWSAAQEIHDDVCANAVGDRGRFTQYLRIERTRRVAAAAADARLLAPERRAHPRDGARHRRRTRATDPSSIATAPEKTDDGIDGEDEGTFTVCSFWLVSALVEIGELDSARDELREAGRRRRARSGSTAKSSIPRPLVTSATSPRPSRTWRSSTPSCT